MKKFKIMKSVYFDKYGVEKYPYYYIKELKTFLTIDYWREIKHLELCGLTDCCKTTTTFKTEALANQFITDILCEGKPVSSWKHNMIDEITCT